MAGLVCHPSLWTEVRKDSLSETPEAIIEEVAIGLVHAKPGNNPHHSLRTHDESPPVTPQLDSPSLASQ
jgi:hypothetical protein